ncbi:MAG TPA: hypothetical protein VFD48_16020 [Pyrinomonadaceae bacterium]|nr:hypothetical protein [Pyrinomonadaceae bacterium]
MQLKFLAISCVALVLSIGLYSFAYRTEQVKPATIEQQSSARTATSSQSESVTTSNDEYIAYRHLFANVYSDAREKEKSNQAVNRAVESYKQSVSLSDDEANLLEKIALETETKTLAIEAQATTVIKRFREKFDAELKSGRKPSTESPELQTLQQQRVRTTLQGRDELRKAFGDSTFSRFDKFLKEGMNLRIEKANPYP